MNDQIGSFSELSNIKGNTVERPKPLPIAYYSAMISGPFTEHKASRSGNIAMRFPIKMVQCLNETAAEEIAGDESLQKAFQKDYKIDFWMSPDARYRFTEFATALGVDPEKDLISMAEDLVALGEPFLVQGKQETNDRGDVFFNIDSPAPLSEYQG